MANYHLHAKFFSRSKGHSATGAAAYRSGEKIKDETNNKTHDYTGRSGVVDTEIYAPDHAPEWATDRSRLWNEVEKAETNKDGSIRKKAQLAQEIEVSLPRELTHAENKTLIEEWVREEFVSKGMIADVSFHESEASDGGKNPHAHIMLTMRDITEDGFGNKNQDWNDGRAGMRKKQLSEMRESWANAQNRHLEKVQETVNHHSYEEQGIKAVPTVHLGKEATALERQGLATRRGDKNREIEEQNNRMWAKVRQTTAAAWEKTKDIFGRKQKEEPEQAEQTETGTKEKGNVLETKDEEARRIAKNQEIEKKNNRIKEAKRVFENEQKSGNLFEKRTGRRTISIAEEQKSIFDALDQTLDPKKEIDEPEIEH